MAWKNNDFVFGHGTSYRWPTHISEHPNVVHYLEDVIALDNAPQIEGHSVLHELWTHFQDEEQIAQKYDNDRIQRRKHVVVGYVTFRNGVQLLDYLIRESNAFEIQLLFKLFNHYT